MAEEPGAIDRADQPAPATEMLLAFLRHRDVRCPGCGYNLRNLTRAECPECREPIELKVGFPGIPVVLFVATLAPSIFGGLIACVLIVMSAVFGDAPDIVLTIITLGLVSGGFGLALLAGRRYRYHRVSRATRKAVCLLTWSVHLLAFFFFVISIR